MNTHAARTNRLLRYTRQPSGLPNAVRRALDADTPEQKPVLFALADLDAELKLGALWCVLTDRALFLIEESGGRRFRADRDSIVEARIQQGLSCSRMLLLGAGGETALASIQFSHRQRPAFEAIKYLLDHPEARPPEGAAEDLYQQSLLRPIETAQASVSEDSSAVLWRLISYMKPYWRRVSAGVLSALAITALQLVPPFLTGHLIDTLVRPVQDGSRDAMSARPEALWLIALLGAAYCGVQFFAWARMRSMALLGEFVARDLRREAYDHLQRLSLSFFSARQTGSLISRVSSDTDRLWEFLAWGFVDFIVAITTLCGLSAVLLWLDWKLGLVMTLPLPVLLFVLFRYGQRMHQLFIRAWRRWSAVTAVLADAIPGIRVVKAFHQEDRERTRFNASNDLACASFNQIHHTWTSFWPFLWLSVQGMALSVWIFAMPRLLGYSPTAEPLQVGVFVSFALYVGMYMQPIEILGRMTFILNRATSSAHRVFEILDTVPEIREAERPVRLEPVQGRVCFDQVSFGYDGVRHVLKNVSFDVAPGEMIGLVGPSGAGKSTITNLIARFYDASHGAIRVDGVDVRELDLGQYRRQLGIVLQDPHLFHGSILDNIRYGMPEADLSAVIAASRAANAHDFICQLPQAYDTVVGERGHTLSGGERQRVSIARAILCNPRILILDEATSSVDTETEHKIQEALDKLVEGRTVFAIAHRLSTLRRADRLFVVDEGRIVEEGGHAELLRKKDGVYQRLVRMQQELHEMYVA
ncbi:MAG: ABC transporter ATP-binding protein [Candidatus Hydrogenedentes bacterium]|nr:ABC transporter ATP-binding protein [Candidatus Hydrogenedentota bacterium]